MKQPLNNKILEKIKTDNVHPKPKWQFILKETSLWLGTIVSLVLASLSAGSLFFHSANAHLIPPHMSAVFTGLRILVIVLFIALAIYQTMKVGQGYKRTIRMYMIIGLSLIGIIGGIMFGLRLSGQIERTIGAPGLVAQANEYWSDPVTHGLLAGELIEVTDDGLLLFNSLEDDIHIVDAQFINEDDHVLFIESLRVKMVGYEEAGLFYPCAIAPWELRRGGYEKHPDYNKLRDGNIRFGDVITLHKNFKDIFERKNEILRTNRC